MVVLIAIASSLSYVVLIGVTWELLAPDRPYPYNPNVFQREVKALLWPIFLTALIGAHMVRRARRPAVTLPKATARSVR